MMEDTTPSPWFNAGVNDVDKAAWERLSLAWSAHLRSLWLHLRRGEASWSWGERTSVGLLATAAVAAGGFSMVELPVGENRPNGRFDLWVSFPDPRWWGCRVEAKQHYVRTAATPSIIKDIREMGGATQQARQLPVTPWQTRAAVLFLIPNPKVTSGGPQRAHADMLALDREIRQAHEYEPGYFGHRFSLDAADTPTFSSSRGPRRHYPGALLIGHILGPPAQPHPASAPIRG